MNKINHRTVYCWAIPTKEFSRCKCAVVRCSYISEESRCTQQNACLRFVTIRKKYSSQKLLRLLEVT